MASVLQKQILHKAIQSPIFSQEVLSQAPSSIFEGGDQDTYIYKDLSNIIKRHYQTSNNILSEETLLTLTEDKLDRMGKSSEEQQKYFNVISGLYKIPNSSDDDEVIDEKIEDFIRKHMRMDLLKQAATRLEDEEFMESLDKKWKDIMLLDISGKHKEIINVLDDTEYKRELLSTINKNTIPTGFRSIDALNSGGLAKGELGMIVSPSGGGKCVSGNSLVVTNRGIVEIQDIPKYFNVDEETNESVVGVPSFTKQGEYKRGSTSHWYDLGESDTIKTVTKSGYSVEGTPEHPLLTMTESGNLEYKKLQDMVEGDYIALAKGTNMWSDTNKVSEEEAYMMALLTADGYLAGRAGLIQLSNSNPDIYRYYKEKAKELWGITNVQTKRRNDSRGAESMFGNKEVKKDLESKGLRMVKSAYKEIPYTVLQSSKPVVKRFVQGMMDTEGSIHDGKLEITTASKAMANQLQTVLLNFGIRASNKEKNVKGYEQIYYRLLISGNALRVFHEEIGLRFNKKNKEKLEKAVIKSTNTNVEIFPYQSKRLKRIRDNHLKQSGYLTGKQKLDGKDISNLLSGQHNPSKNSLDYILKYTLFTDEDTYFLKTITNNFIFEPVVYLENSKTVVYDFTVPEIHSFVANGIVNHNTMMMTNLATNYTKEGYNVFFIALEELENRMILKFEQSMLHQTRSSILTDGNELNESMFDSLQNIYKKNRNVFGNLFFARYSPRTITPAKIEQLISDVMIRQGVDIDVVVIDYPDILRNPQATGNESEDGGKLFEEMRRIGQDYDVVMWTASQMNRTAYSADVRTSEHMEGSHRKKNASELVLTMNQTPEEYNAGFTRLYADKVRNPPEGPYDRMIGFRVEGSAMTVRDYRDDKEKEEHNQVLENSSDQNEKGFKSKSKQNQSNQTPDFASEINSALVQDKESNVS